MAAPDQNAGGVWVDTCQDYWNEQDCLTPLGPEGYYRCEWIPTALNVDCELLWPTPSPTSTETTTTLGGPLSPSPTVMVVVDTTEPTTEPTLEPTSAEDDDDEDDGDDVGDCPPGAAVLYFESDDVCSGYFEGDAGGSELQCQVNGLEPWYIPGCGCGCVDMSIPIFTTSKPPTTAESVPSPQPTEAVSCDEVPDGAMGVGTPDSTCSMIAIDCLPGYSSWYIRGCGCGCYPLPTDTSSSTPSSTPTSTPSSTPSSTPTSTPSSTPSMTVMQPTMEPTNVCPPPNGDILVGRNVEIDGIALCDLLEAGEFGGIMCAYNWFKYFGYCGCGCAPNMTDALPPNVNVEQEMLYGADLVSIVNRESREDHISTVSQVLNHDISLTAVLLMLAATFALYQTYRCVASNRSDGYTKLEEKPLANYQSI